ncbi:MAG: hypothetical protein AAB499_00445 [Patescibacteria group bacterium]
MDQSSPGVVPSSPAPASAPAPAGESGGYGKGGGWKKWLLIYVVIAVVVYGAVYFIWLKPDSDGSGANTSIY